MSQAIGVIETGGLPAAIAIADWMEKFAAVQVIGMENAGSGRMSVVVRGDIGAVRVAMGQTVHALKGCPGMEILGHHIVSGAGEVSSWGGAVPSTLDETSGWLDD